MKTKKIVYAGVLLAIAILLPQAFHLTGVPRSGAVFLPMHIPVLLAGFIVGPVLGCIIGILAPIISFLMTNMPTSARLPFMIVELGVYGLTAGLMYQTFKLHKFKFGIYISLLTAMIIGRAAYALAIVVGSHLLNLQAGSPAAVITAISLGVVGICIQLVLIPAIVYALKRGGFILNEK